MILYVRGGLGMQVLETMVGFAKAIERNEDVSEIRISTGGLVVDPVKHNFLGTIVDAGVPIRTSDSTLKQNSWTRENFELLVKHYEKVLSKLLIKNVSFFPNLHIFHTRGKDRQLISTKTYQSLIFEKMEDGNIIHLIGDDRDIIDNMKVGSYCTVSDKDPVEDWKACIKARSITGPFSTFTLSAWLLRPHIHYTVFGPKFNDNMQISRELYELLNILFKGIKGNGRIRYE